MPESEEVEMENNVISAMQEKKKMEMFENLLKEFMESDTIKPEYLGEFIEKMKRKDILKLYSEPWHYEKLDVYLWHMPDPTAREGRRQIQRKTKEEMERFIVDFHRNGANQSPTVEDAFNEYLDFCYEAGFPVPNTLNRYANYFNKYIAIDEIARLPIASVKERNIERLLNKMVKGKKGDDRVTRKAFNEVKSIVNNIFCHAKTELEVDCIETKGCMIGIKYHKKHFKKSIKRDEECVYSEDEFKKISDYVVELYRSGEAGTRELGVLFSLTSGVRVGELSCIKYSDLRGNILTLSRHLSRDRNSKYFIDEGLKEGEEPKDVILCDNAMNVWKSLRKVNLKNGNPTDYMFYDEAMPVHKNLVTHHFDTTLRQICKAINIPFRSPHKTRSTYTSMNLNNGMNPSDVQKNLGHKELSTTLKHYHYKTKSTEQLTKEFNNAQSFEIAL